MARGSATVWLPLPYTSTWTDFGYDYRSGQYMREASGRVTVRGLAVKSSGTLINGDIVATLPAGFCPALREIFTVNGANGGTSYSFRMDVLANGQIVVEGPASGGAGGYMSLSGIFFWVY
jgi:hypothetical protein